MRACAVYNKREFGAAWGDICFPIMAGWESPQRTGGDRGDHMLCFHPCLPPVGRQVAGLKKKNVAAVRSTLAADEGRRRDDTYRGCMGGGGVGQLYL